MDLKQYEESKFAIADVIRSALSIDPSDSESRSAGHELLVRLADDRFNLMVVGRFSRGKSTLLNALLGGRYLPTGIVPLTSVITTIRYGSRPQALIHFLNSTFRSEVPLDRLSDYVTQQSNPGNSKGIALAEILLPVEILRRGYFFVDSPGLGSSIRENTRTTEQFLPEADAFILVTSYDSALSEEEDELLNRIGLTSKKLFVVLNKQDMVDQNEKATAISYLQERLGRHCFSETPLVFSLSARLGLAEKESQHSGLSELSGLGAFERELSRFLTEERARHFLASMSQRVAAFLADRLSAARTDADRAPFQGLGERLPKLWMEVNSLDPVSPGTRVAPVSTDTEYALSIDKKTGCRVCGAILDAVFKFLSRYQYELTINPETQQEHTRRSGFCPLHTWQYENIASPYGVCASYPLLAHRIADRLHTLAAGMLNRADPALGREEILSTGAKCKICQVRADAENRAVKDAAKDIRDAFASHQGRFPACCLRHLGQVSQVLKPDKAAQALVRAHAILLERTSEDLRRYALRHDALRRHLTSAEERNAATLILLLLAGHRSISAPWNVETII